jgi:hypothetical protein
MRRVACFLFCALVAAGASCGRTTPDEGRDAALAVKGGQFFRERLPDAADGPKVRSVALGPSFAAGSVDRACSGDLDREGTAVAIGLEGDVGYWILPAGLPSVAAMNAPTFEAALSFSAQLAPGSHDLVLRAVDRARHFGPSTVRKLQITERSVPEGELVVALSWSDAADLDLHVVDPRGVEIFKRNQNSYEPPAPGSAPDPPGAPHDGGVLDLDSNGGCVPDGRRAENVVWKEPPPPGHYLVRVDTFSLCGEPSAFWRLAVYRRGARIATASGASTGNDERYAHDRGDGLLAIEFDVRD